MGYLSDFDITILTICGIAIVLSWIGYRLSDKFYRFKYKDQKVGVRTKWWRK